MNQAKATGKLRRDYQVPEQFRSNYPEAITRALASVDRDQLFSLFPFGTDLREEERVLGRAWKALKRKSQSRMVIRAIFQRKVPEAQKPYLERMKLLEATGLKERVLRGLLVNELKHDV